MQLAESVDRVMRTELVFGSIFYQHFFAAVPEASRYFEGIDMRRQAFLVTMALTVIQQHHDHHYPVTRDYLHYLGSKHHDRKIPIELYIVWRRVMLGTLAVFHGHDWTPELESAWGAAIDRAIDAMAEGYANHVSV